MPFFRQSLLCISFFSQLLAVSLAQSPVSVQSLTSTSAIPAATSSSGQVAAPICASACIQTAENTQSCHPDDQTCLCSASTQIQESVYKCLATSTCNDNEKIAAFQYYPIFCKSLNLATETRIATTTTSAGGATSIQSQATTGIVQASVTTTTTPGNNQKNIHAGLQLPAILGIVLAVMVMILGVGVILVWSFLRRRQMMRRPRMDLGGEFVEAKPRPPRSKSVNSDFLVQPSPIEKDHSFGESLSRSSTLVPPPPVAKDEKRSSDEKRNSARNRALRNLLGDVGLRASLLSTRSGSKKSSLVVPLLDIRKSQQDDLRVSKF